MSVRSGFRVGLGGEKICSILETDGGMCLGGLTLHGMGECQGIWHRIETSVTREGGKLGCLEVQSSRLDSWGVVRDKKAAESVAFGVSVIR